MEMQRGCMLKLRKTLSTFFTVRLLWAIVIWWASNETHGKDEISENNKQKPHSLSYQSKNWSSFQKTQKGTYYKGNNNYNKQQHKAYQAQNEKKGHENRYILT